ncbi:MAG: TIGR04282 family arsenosugar biosynthesis glycosyltransferase [Bacteroidia bacterium]
METRKNALVIFTKNPVVGKVKTRLAKDIGDKMALKVYMQLLKHTREITKENGFCETKIFYDNFIPSNDNWDESNYDKYLQGAGDLATKMKNAYKTMFDEGYENVIIMSPDCPELTSARIKQAFALLKNKNFVIGPLKDGGYYLLGMNKFSPEVINGIEFGKGTAYAETLKRFESLGASYKELAETYDVDFANEIPAKLRKIVGLEETTLDSIDEENIEEAHNKADEEEFSSDNEATDYSDIDRVDDEED